MKKFLALILGCLILSSCQKTSDKVSLQLTPDEYPRVDGSTATIPLAINLRSKVTGEDAEELKLSTVHSKTDYAMYTLQEGLSDLLLIYTPADEILEEAKNQGFEFIMEPIGRDALVFITNKDNTIDSLTTEQIQDIYQGKIKNWQEVGGADSPLEAYQRNPTSGSQVMMEKLVMNGKELEEPPVEKYIGGMGELVESVIGYSNDEGALGYSVYYYIKNFFEEDINLKLVEVDGVMPSNKTIEDNSYPFTENFYVIIRKDEPKDSNTYKLYELLKSDEGKNIIKDSGYVAVDHIAE